MQAEIITVGTEILLGQIQNTNATYLAQQLAQLGIESHYQTTIGDYMPRIEAAVNTAVHRNELVIVCGGVGPTADDQTKQAVAQALGTKLVIDPAQMQRITTYFQARQKRMVAGNEKQAEYLQGGEILANINGFAIGDFYQASPEAAVVILPGPPHEMTAMFEQSLRPLLIKKYALDQHLVNHDMFFYGISESELMNRITAMVVPDTRLSIASYAQDHAIKVRLTASTDSPAIVAQLTKLEKKIQTTLSEYYLGNRAEQSIVQQVVTRLKQQHLMITAAESLTAGLFQSTLCNISGASSVFHGGFVTYADEVKEQLLGIEHHVIAQYGVVSEPVARQMAEKSRALMKADIGVSFTGVAGPDSLEGQLPGTVWMAIAQTGQATQAFELHVSNADRQTVREKSVWQMFYELYRRLK